MRPFSLHSHLLLRITVKKQSVFFWCTKLKIHSIHVISFKTRGTVMLSYIFAHQSLFSKTRTSTIVRNMILLVLWRPLYSTDNWNIFRNYNVVWCQSKGLVCLVAMSFYYTVEVFKEVINLQKQQLQEQRILLGILSNCVFLLYQGLKAVEAQFVTSGVFWKSSHLWLKDWDW